MGGVEKCPPQKGSPQVGLTNDAPIWPKDLEVAFKRWDYFGLPWWHSC